MNEKPGREAGFFANSYGDSGSQVFVPLRAVAVRHLKTAQVGRSNRRAKLFCAVIVFCSEGGCGTLAAWQP
jgi:hypothetical protein